MDLEILIRTVGGAFEAMNFVVVSRRMSEPLVSVGLPVRNGEHLVGRVVASVLAQDYQHLELVICDNASTDATEDVCRELARNDERVVYHRQPENIGLLRNFQSTIDRATGEYFRWIGHDDCLSPRYVSTLLAPLLADDTLLLMTSGIEYELDDGSSVSTSYSGHQLGSGDAADRFVEVLRMSSGGFASVPDPLYGLMRRTPAAAIPRRNILWEDETFAAKLALAGRWGHEPAILAKRGWSHDRAGVLAKKLDVRRRDAFTAWTLQAKELLRVIESSDLDPRQRRRARFAVGQLYVTRHRRRVERGIAKGQRRISTLASRS